MGESGDIPLAGNFVAGKRADFPVFRPTTGTWHIRQNAPLASGPPKKVVWGQSTDIPV